MDGWVGAVPAWPSTQLPAWLATAAARCSACAAPGAVHHTPMHRAPPPPPACRAKHESALRSTQGQREALDRRVAEQERGIEARLDAVEAALLVRCVFMCVCVCA